jgi:hypothetical protein
MADAGPARLAGLAARVVGAGLMVTLYLLICAPVFAVAAVYVLFIIAAFGFIPVPAPLPIGQILQGAILMPLMVAMGWIIEIKWGLCPAIAGAGFAISGFAFITKTTRLPWRSYRRLVFAAIGGFALALFFVAKRLQHAMSGQAPPLPSVAPASSPNSSLLLTVLFLATCSCLPCYLTPSLLLSPVLGKGLSKPDTAQAP